MAGSEGFEPPNAGTKTRCLTTWPRPTVAICIPSIINYRDSSHLRRSPNYVIENKFSSVSSFPYCRRQFSPRMPGLLRVDVTSTQSGDLTLSTFGGTGHIPSSRRKLLIAEVLTKQVC